jgi:hypothetical protein
MLHIGTQIYLIGFCEPIKGTQFKKSMTYRSLAYPVLVHTYSNHTSMKNIIYMSKANDPDQHIGKQSWSGVAGVLSNG